MFQQITKKRVIATLSIAAISTLLVQAYVFAQPTSNPPGGNVEATFNKVGIGTGTPTESLVVGDDLGNVSFFETLTIGDTAATGAPGITIGESTDDNARINWDSSNNNLTMYTKNAGSSNPSQLVLANDGNIGIGAPSPFAQLQIGIPTLNDAVFAAAHPDSLAIASNETSEYAAIWLGMDPTHHGEIVYDNSNYILSLENNSTEDHPAQLMLDDNGNIGINAGPIVNTSALEVQAFNPASVGQVILGKYDNNNYGALGKNGTGVKGIGTTSGVVGQYDTNNYGVLGTVNTGATGIGEKIGVSGKSVPDLNSNTDNYGVYGAVTPNGTGTYYSGYFAKLLGSGGTYKGLFADLITTDHIQSSTGTITTDAISTNSLTATDSDPGAYGIYTEGGQGGIKAKGGTYSIYAESDPIYGSGEVGYGIYSQVIRGHSEGNYFSGFFEDKFDVGNYSGLYADTRSGDGFDLAEYILDSNDNLEAAEIVIADPNNSESVIKSSTPYDTSTLGVVSTDPHIIMGMDLIMDEETHKILDNVNAVKLALAGRVPMKVTNENGQIKPGDLLTTSSTPGYAMKWTPLDETTATNFEELKTIMAENTRRQNAIIGKAVDSLDSAEGTIVALLSL